MQYLVTANINTAPDMAGMRDGYQPGHPVATVGWFDIEAASFEAAAAVMFDIGNGYAADAEGQTWPAGTGRSLSVGDLLYLADADSNVRILAVARYGWTEVAQPPNRLQGLTSQLEARLYPAA